MALQLYKRNKSDYLKLKGMTGNTGRKLNKKQARQVKTLIARRQELKFFAPVSNYTSMTSTPYVTSISSVPQGDTDSERDGDRLQWCGVLNFDFNIIIGQGVTGDVWDICRIIIFQWHPNSTPTASSILLSGYSGAIDNLSQYNHDNRQEYKILYDNRHVVTGPGYQNTTTFVSSPITSTSAIHRKVRIKMYSKRVSKYVQFVAGSTAGTNLIYLMYMSDSALSGHPGIAYTIKLFFRDS